MGRRNAKEKAKKRGKPFAKGWAGGPGRPKGVKTLAKRSAAEILAEQDEVKMWGRFLNSTNEKVGLEALKYLTDRRDGRAAQTLNLEGKGAIAVYFGNLPIPNEYRKPDASE